VSLSNSVTITEDWVTQRNILPGHSDSVLCLMFDESKIVTGSKDQTIKIWDFASKTLKESTSSTSLSSSSSFSKKSYD